MPLTERDIQRFNSKAIRTPGCWGWTGSFFKAGYAIFNLKSEKDGVWRPGYAHRVSYVIHKGPIPEGLEIDHLCRNRACMNPDHLEAVPHKVNANRGESPSNVLARLGQCAKGHKFTDENTYIRPSGKRECRTCLQGREHTRYVHYDRALYVQERHRCLLGHLMDEANTYWHPRGTPTCRACGAERMQRKRNL